MTQACLAVERVREDAVRIVVGGEIDLANAAAVKRQIVEAISNQLTEVTLDLTTLIYIDSAGLRVLFTLGTRLETLQIALELLVPTESPIRKMIELSGIAALYPCGRRGIDGGLLQGTNSGGTRCCERPRRPES